MSGGLRVFLGPLGINLNILRHAKCIKKVPKRTSQIESVSKVSTGGFTSAIPVKWNDPLLHGN